MHRKIADLWVHTRKKDPFMRICPTINLFVGFLHRLSLHLTSDARRFDIE